jgi:preprotein translocase subunit YajC
MSFLMTEAYAAGSGAAPAADASSFILLIGFVVIFYFFLIRPQNRRAKEQRNLIASLNKGDEVVTTGGILGRISKVTDDFIVVEISTNVEVTLQKSYIASVVPKGTMKSV